MLLLSLLSTMIVLHRGNDTPCDATEIDLTSLSYSETLSVSTNGATQDNNIGLPSNCHFGFPRYGGLGVWYKLTLPSGICNGPTPPEIDYEFHYTCNYDGYMSIFTMDDCNTPSNAICVFHNDDDATDGGLCPRAKFSGCYEELYIMIHAFSTETGSGSMDISVECLDNCPDDVIDFSCQRRVGSTVFADFSSVSCEPGETLVSCGIEGVNQIYGTFIDPSDPNTCTVGQTDNNSMEGVEPVAVCCTFPENAIESITTITSISTQANGLQIVTQCPANTELTGCQVNYESGNIDNIRGSYPGPLQNINGPPSQVDTIGIDTENQCIAEAKTLDGTIRGGAQCIEPACGYDLDCLTTGKLTTNDGFDGQCPFGYNLVACNVYSPTNALKDWYYTSDGGCSIGPFQGYANAICCKLSPTQERNCDCTRTAEYNVQIIIDESGSIGDIGYFYSTQFAKSLIENVILDTSPVSVFSFGSIDIRDVEVIYRFSDPQNDDREGVLDALDSARWNGGGTPTLAAMQVGIAEYEDAIANGDINDGERFIFLLTNDIPTRGDPCLVVDDLIRLGIRVIILGIGDLDVEPIECLADPDDIFIVDGLEPEDFEELEIDIADLLCDEPEESIQVPENPLPCREAQKYCKDTYGTNLATIRTNADRRNAILSLDKAGEDRAWIGLYSDDVETKWQFRSGDECPSKSAYKCVDFWLEAPGGGPNRPRCIGTSEKGYECAVIYASGLIMIFQRISLCHFYVIVDLIENSEMSTLNLISFFVSMSDIVSFISFIVCFV